MNATRSEPRFEQPPVKWWPFRPRYIRRMYQYLAFTTGRGSPMALVRDKDGSRFASDILKPARHPDDTGTVRVVKEDGRIYEIETKQIVDIDSSRAQAGYDY